MKNKSMGELMLDIFEKLQPKKMMMLLVFLLVSFVAMTQTSTYSYKGKNYETHLGPRGGHFIILEDKSKYYLPTLKVDPKTGEVIYKGVKYKPERGSKGGTYILTDKGTKIYLPHL